MANLTEKEKKAAEELALALCGEPAESAQEPAQTAKEADTRCTLLRAYNRAIAALEEIAGHITDKPELCKKLISAECELRADRCVTFEELVDWERIANG